MDVGAAFTQRSLSPSLPAGTLAPSVLPVSAVPPPAASRGGWLASWRMPLESWKKLVRTRRMDCLTMQQRHS